MIYSVKFRKCGAFFWRKINVKVDLTMASEGIPVRVFILENETRLEIPMLGYEFEFCPRRHLAIKANMERESGQKITTN
jgi:hypothetical protein